MPAAPATDCLRAVLDGVAEGVVIVDAAMAVVFNNRSAERILGPGLAGLLPAASAGLSAEQYGTFLSDRTTLCAPQSLPVCQALTGKPVSGVELFVRNAFRASGGCLKVSAFPLTGDNGQVTGAVCVFSEITDAQQLEAQLSLAQMVISQTNEAILVTDADERIIFVNDAFSRVTGFDSIEIIGRPLAVLRSGLQGDEFIEDMEQRLVKDGFWTGEFLNRRKTGEIYPIWANISVVRDDLDRVSNLVAVFTDLTGAKELDEKLYRLANVDSVTSLPNRKVFFEHLDQAIQRSSRHGHKCGVVFFDLDHFKEINDSLGHAAGDDFLRGFAALLAAAVGPDHFIARLGGDEFAVVVEGVQGDMDLALFIERIQRNLAVPILLDRQEILPSASIGVAISPDDGLDAETLAKAADTALTAVKQSGAGTDKVQFFTQRMNISVVKHFWTETNLRKALGTDQLIPYFQPQVNLATNLAEEAEVLVRWKHPVRGLISPGDFIPIAEKTGLIEAVSEQILSSSCALLGDWRRRNIPIKVIAVNLSAKDFARPDLIDMVAGTVARHGVKPSDILLEITESAIMDKQDVAVAICKKFKELGFWLALDDFGTGYSSLSYLHQLPVDQVKIDRSFIIDIATRKESLTITKAIIALCSTLGYETLAEGVETREQLEVLGTIGCNKIQGYLVSKPLPPAEFEKFLVEHAR